jgi:hypothetical protein
MEDLFVEALKDINYAEKQILKALPGMGEKGRLLEAQGGAREPLLGDRRSGRSAGAGLQDVRRKRARQEVRGDRRHHRRCPLVKAGNCMNHLEYDWESPIWGHLLRGLSEDQTLIRYDARGNGLSDWEVDELSLEAWVKDLEW